MISAVRFLYDVQTALQYRFGNNPIPCGVTAADVENSVSSQFTTCSLSDICPEAKSLVFRLHFELDADNVSIDHVLFLVPAEDGLHLLQSYVDQRPVTVEMVPWRWLDDLGDMLHKQDASMWCSAFRVTHATFCAPLVISCHSSKVDIHYYF